MVWAFIIPTFFVHASDLALLVCTNITHHNCLQTWLRITLRDCCWRVNRPFRGGSRQTLNPINALSEKIQFSSTWWTQLCASQETGYLVSSQWSTKEGGDRAWFWNKVWTHKKGGQQGSTSKESKRARRKKGGRCYKQRGLLGLLT